MAVSHIFEIILIPTVFVIFFLPLCLSIPGMLRSTKFVVNKTKMNLLEYIPIVNDHVIRAIKNDFFEKYHFLIDSQIKHRNPKTEQVLITPSEEFKFKETSDGSRYEHEYWRRFEVVWFYSIDNVLQLEKNHLRFDFWGIGYIDVTANYFSFEVIDPYKYHLKKVQDLKIKSAKELNIPNLRSYESDYINTDFVGKFMSICRENNPVIAFEDFPFANDLVYLSKELSYILAELNLFRPYLRDFQGDPMELNDKMNNNSNIDEIKQLQEWKIGLIDEFRSLYKDSLLGIEKAMILIENKK